MSETNPIARIVTYESPCGTRYIAERRMWKTRWFSESGWVWEPFVRVERDFHHTSGFKKLLEVDMYHSRFADKDYAEWACKEWARVQSSGKVIKTWSVEDD